MNFSRQSYSKRIARAVFGLMICGAGAYCSVQAGIGCGVWEAFSAGVSARLGLSFGTVLAGSDLLILAADLLMHETIGLGTLLDVVCVGAAADALRLTGLVPAMTTFPAAVALLLFGQLLIAVGSCFFISAGLSCCPHDALMVALCKRFPRVPVGAIRFLIEGSALLVGWLCGAPIGAGTVIAVFGISLIIQAVFTIARFDVRAVKHESLAATVRGILGR